MGWRLRIHGQSRHLSWSLPARPNTPLHPLYPTLTTEKTLRQNNSHSTLPWALVLYVCVWSVVGVFGYCSEAYLVWGGPYGTCWDSSKIIESSSINGCQASFDCWDRMFGPHWLGYQNCRAHSVFAAFLLLALVVVSGLTPAMTFNLCDSSPPPHLRRFSRWPLWSGGIALAFSISALIAFACAAPQTDNTEDPNNILTVQWGLSVYLTGTATALLAVFMGLWRTGERLIEREWRINGTAADSSTAVVMLPPAKEFQLTDIQVDHRGQHSQTRRVASDASASVRQALRQPLMGDGARTDQE